MVICDIHNSIDTLVVHNNNTMISTLHKKHTFGHGHFRTVCAGHVSDDNKFKMMIDDMNFVATNINNEAPSINHVLGASES
jgi:hypothetical protein